MKGRAASTASALTSLLAQTAFANREPEDNCPNSGQMAPNPASGFASMFPLPQPHSALQRVLTAHPPSSSRGN
ncbi:MAG: hypothetical protein ACREP9_18960, partial [Candidatus Dormibacteraceae bacterium]